MHQEKPESRTECTEKRVADTMLQTEISVTLNGKTYAVAPPTLATLIKVSEAVARMPRDVPDEASVMSDCLRIARDCKPIAEIVALLILGAKQATKPVRRPWWQFWQKRKPTQLEQLMAEVLNGATPHQLHEMLARLLGQMQIADFFGLTTFLCEINLTKPTKVVTEATAPGQ